jgi:hypothetical protein
MGVRHRGGWVEKIVVLLSGLVVGLEGGEKERKMFGWGEAKAGRVQSRVRLALGWRPVPKLKQTRGRVLPVFSATTKIAVHVVRAAEFLRVWWHRHLGRQSRPLRPEAHFRRECLLVFAIVARCSYLGLSAVGRPRLRLRQDGFPQRLHPSSVTTTVHTHDLLNLLFKSNLTSCTHPRLMLHQELRPSATT